MRQFILVVTVLGSLVSLMATAAEVEQLPPTAWNTFVFNAQDERIEEKGDDEKVQEDGATEQVEEESEEEITLERLFPEKSYFGPSARSMAFSTDGK